MTRINDPQLTLLNMLVAAALHNDAFLPWAHIEAHLGSPENVWQVIHRLRDRGVKIRTFTRPRGDPWRGGYALAVPSDEALAAFEHSAGRLGFDVLS